MLIHGDCLNRLKKLETDSVDSLVTDPPAGISFMGKEWDSDKGGRDGWITWMTEVMVEVKRVLKPGAHGLVWAIPRTSHWTATALENAGFEVRDVVTHLFGSGFPKSLDISKAIDKASGAKREVLGTKDVGPDHRGSNYSNKANGERMISEITAPSTEAAKQWQGWGTALKPASEHWILVRKTCSEKTVAANVLKHGTGGINIDASRIGCTDKAKFPAGVVSKTENNFGAGKGMYDDRPRPEDKYSQGRFPANLVLSHSQFCTDDQCDIECAIDMLDTQSGDRPSKAGGSAPKSGHWGNSGEGLSIRRNDSGGASRFFYCAKISSSERGEDNTHPTVKPKKLMSYLIRMITPTGGTVLDPFMGSGSTGIAAKECGFKFIGIEKEKDYFDIASKRIRLS